METITSKFDKARDFSRGRGDRDAEPPHVLPVIAAALA
jgi:hypothetical protein